MSDMRNCDAMNAEQKSVVLVVEDEAVIRLETVLAIEDAGYAVLATGNADEAMAILKTRDDISAVFTEIRIPGHHNGLDLGQAIAKRWPLVRLIMTSGDRRRDNMPAEWLYIQKPYCGSQIIDALRAPAPLSPVFAGCPRRTSAASGLRTLPVPPLCIALDRARGRIKESIKAFLDDGVTLTRRLFEAGSVENQDFPTPIADQSGRLHRLRRKCHRFSIGTQHV